MISIPHSSRLLIQGKKKKKISNNNQEQTRPTLSGQGKTDLTNGEESQDIPPEFKVQNLHQFKQLIELNTKENNQQEPFKVIISSSKFRFQKHTNAACLQRRANTICTHHIRAVSLLAIWKECYSCDKTIHHTLELLNDCHFSHLHFPRSQSHSG